MDRDEWSVDRGGGQWSVGRGGLPGLRHYDVASCAFHDGDEFRQLGGGNVELIEGLSKVFEESLPFVGRDLQFNVGIPHGAPAVALGSAGRLANLLGNQIFEASPGNAVVSLIDERIGIESRVVHDAVDEIVHDCGNGIDATETLVKCRWRTPL